MQEQKILALYFRISDEDKDLKINVQKDESNSIRAQRSLAYHYLEKLPDLSGYQIREFQDDGYSGTHMNRPALQEMLELVRKGYVKCIIVKDMSRFGRNYIETGSYIEQIFPYLGIRFISINDRFDSLELSERMPETDVAFKNILYDFYSKDLSNKIKSIKKMQQKEGKFVAAKPPYGYLISEENRYKLTIDKASAPYVRLIFGMALQGMLPSEIADYLNRQKIPTPVQRNYAKFGFQDRWYHQDNINESYWTNTAVLKILKDDTMYGCTINNRVQVKSVGSRSFKRQAQKDFIIVPDTHEAIIDKDTFMRVQNMIQARAVSHSPQQRFHENLFGGILYCGECESRLRHEVHYRGKKEALYYCPRARHTKGEGCSRKTIKDEALEQIIFTVLETLLRTLANWEELNSHVAKRLYALQKQIDACKNKIQHLHSNLPQLYEDYCSHQLSRDDFVRQKEAIHGEITKLQKSIVEKGTLLINYDKEMESSTADWLKTLKTGEKQELATAFFERIYLYPSGHLQLIVKGRNELAPSQIKRIT